MANKKSILDKERGKYYALREKLKFPAFLIGLLGISFLIAGIWSKIGIVIVFGSILIIVSVTLLLVGNKAYWKWFRK